MHCAMRAFPLLPCTEIPTGLKGRPAGRHCASAGPHSAAQCITVERKERVHTPRVVGQRCTVSVCGVVCSETFLMYHAVFYQRTLKYIKNVEI